MMTTLSEINGKLRSLEDLTHEYQENFSGVSREKLIDMNGFVRDAAAKIDCEMMATQNAIIELEDFYLNEFGESPTRPVMRALKELTHARNEFIRILEDHLSVVRAHMLQ